MAEMRDTQLGDPTLAPPSRKALNNLVTSWAGLTVIIEHPWFDLDNKAAERALRPAVVARKNFYGSGSEWSAVLAANMQGLLMTSRHWKLHVRRWLQGYPQAFSDAGGRAVAAWRCCACRPMA